MIHTRLTFFLVLIGFFVGTTSLKAQNTDKSQNLADISQEKEKGRPDLPGSLMIDHGFNLLPDMPSSLRTKFWASRGFNIAYLYPFDFGSWPLSLNAGLGLSNERYHFNKNNTLVTTNNSGNTAVQPLDSTSSLGGANIRKTLFTATYVDVPVEFRFYFNKEDKKRSPKIVLGAKAGYLIGGKTKIKYREDGETKKVKQKEDFNLNEFRVGAYAKVGFGNFYLFYYQSLTPLYEGGKGPQGVSVKPITVGLSIDFF